MTRFFDILFSGLAILILTPFMIPLAIMLTLTGEHDIFYTQKRIGRFGREFGLLKFATMLRNSPNLPGGLYTSENDTRLLPFGKFLRKTKINELPQLINIFIGQMSIVGYRPTVREHFEAYPEEARKVLYDSRPGLSGIGSIAFRNEEEILCKFDDKEFFHKYVISPYKAELECWYVEHGNVMNYFKIIFLTALIVLSPKKVAWRDYFKNLPSVPEKLLGLI
jgi:lipopolysaccharide/colanic/teichoic acid biosynthesis glycosyltransferase